MNKKPESNGIVNEWLHKTYSVEPNIGYEQKRPRLICKDGYSVSIQADTCTYCTPRLGGDIDYTEVELGFPSEPDDLIMDFAEDEDWTDTVYGYVPVYIVNKLIEKHGGIDYEKSLKEIK